MFLTLQIYKFFLNQPAYTDCFFMIFICHFINPDTTGATIRLHHLNILYIYIIHSAHYNYSLTTVFREYNREPKV